MKKPWIVRYVTGKKDHPLWPVMDFPVPWEWTDEQAAEYLKNQGYEIVRE